MKNIWKHTMKHTMKHVTEHNEAETMDCSTPATSDRADGRGSVAATLRRATDQRGMTLIEIMVVIVIIGILGSALAVGVFGMLGEAREDTAKAQVNTVGGIIEAYEARYGDYPDSLQAMTEGKHARLKAGNLKDPWRQDLNYSVEGDGFSLCSNGDDKKQGTEDDVCYGDQQR